MGQQPRLLHSVEGEKSHPQGAVAAIHGVIRTHPGLRRSENQDASTTIESKHFVAFAVADGIGSTAGGAMAARLAIRTFKRSLLRLMTVDERALSDCLSQANAAVLDHAVHAQELRGMGTTMVVLGFSGTELLIANIGDSRAYRLRGGQLVPLTQDHTVAFELVRSGLLTPEQGKNNPVSHLLTKALGTADTLEVDCWRSTDGPRRGDRYLLCSDGLHNLVPDDRIKELLNGSATESAESLIAEANSCGGTDNVTVAIIDVGPEFPVGDERHQGGEDAEIQDIPELLPGKPEHAFPEATVFIKDTPLQEAEEPIIIREEATEIPPPSPLYLWLMIIFFTFIGGLGLGMGTWALLSHSRDNAARTEQPRNPVARINVTSEPTVSSSTVETTKETIERAKEFVSLPERRDTPEVEELVKKYDARENGIELAKKDLADLRTALDLQTRKLALWYNRHQKIQTTDPLELAESVAVTSPDVKEKRQLYMAAQEAYLKEAETLVYNPLDSQQETKVAELARERDQKRAELVSAVRSYVDASLSGALSEVMGTSLMRDRLQAAVGIISKQIDSAGEASK